jgi:hypothetical protein
MIHITREGALLPLCRRTPPGLDRGKPTDKKVGPRPNFRFLLTVTGIHR